MIRKSSDSLRALFVVALVVQLSCARPQDGDGKSFCLLEEAPANLPIDLKRLTTDFPEAKDNPQSLLSLEIVNSGLIVEPDGIAVRYSGEITLLDGTVIQGGNMTGSVLFGPWPFAEKDARFRAKRFYRKAATVNSTELTSLSRFFEPTTTNSEGWKPGDQGRFALRLNLSVTNPDESSGKTTHSTKSLGFFDTFLTVRMKKDGTLVRQSTILEGPAINLVTSDHPDRVVISLVSDEDKPATVILDDAREIQGGLPRKAGDGWFRHEITVNDLEPDHEYRYRVRIGDTESHPTTFRTAPVKGASDFRFAFIGDSRAGVGNSMTDVAAVNVDAMDRLCGVADREDVDLVLFGGDFSTGYTQVEADFRTQLRVWKQSIAGISDRIPFYPIPGNHEALMRTFDDPSTEFGVSFDRWPYERHSTEAVFADEFINPKNGPVARPGFPSYSETAYSFQYGSVRFIGFNTNYWLETDSPNDGSGINQMTKLYGGCPEGYVMSEQLEWLKEGLAAAENDPTVKFIVLFAHEPMFPNGKHIEDAMWYHGDNGSRACVFTGGVVKPETLGVIEVRNILARAISESSKVACVINSDEHALYRTLIDSHVPAGDESDIDPETNRIDPQELSPITGLKRATWYLVSGGGGAPYSAELKSPWNSYWKAQEPNHGYFYTPQENLILFEVTSDGISMTARNAFGEAIDHVENLMDVRQVAD